MRKIFSLLLLLFTLTSHAYPTDADISFNILAQIGRTFCLRYLSIEVTTRDCIATLRGAAFTNENAERLIRIAASTYGVKDVDISNLTLEYGIPPSIDTIIMGKIRGFYIRENLFCTRCATVHVASIGGMVYLTGYVSNELQREKAIAIAQSVTAVRGVQADILVTTTPIIRFPFNLIWG